MCTQGGLRSDIPALGAIFQVRAHSLKGAGLVAFAAAVAITKDKVLKYMVKRVTVDSPERTSEIFLETLW